MRTKEFVSFSRKNVTGSFDFFITNFENNNPYPYYPSLTDTINPWIIDNSNPDNIWQIGKSYKAAFDTAYSMPNAIITDTINPYPINNHSTFQFLIKKPEWANDMCLSRISIAFRHKFNTDTLKDGGYIDISFDMGETWTNIIDDTMATEIFTHYFYDNTDTLIGDKRGFSGGATNEWESSGFEWNLEDNDEARKLDSVTIRFNFISDGINNIKAGWIIDNIDITIEDWCTVGIDDISTKSEILIYPNPVRDISILELPESNSDYQIQIFNVLGYEILNCISRNSIEINRRDFNPGTYIYKLSNSKNQTFTGKFIVE